MVFRYLNRPRGGSTRAFDTDVLAWEAAVVANGGSVSLARRIILDQFVFSEKASGAWALTDDYWGLWGENAPQALTSLKQLRLAVATNSPTFTADRGYVFNGTTNYVATGFIPNTHCIAATASNARVGAYVRSDVTGSSNDFGCESSSSRRLRLNSRLATTAIVLGNVNTSTYTLPASTSLGFVAGNRNGATAADCAAYKNGVAMTRIADATTFGTPLPIVEMFIGGYNAAGVLTLPSTRAVGLTVVGAALSAAQELAQYNAVQAWATSIGAQV